MVNQLYSGAVSACFELQNSEPYYAPQPYALYLDGTFLREGDTNVFSLYGLKPDTEYLLRVVLRDEAGTAEECSFRTDKETCAVDVRAFGAAGDGVTDDTRAIQTAIHCLPEGGRLHVPAGTYLTGPLFLKSHMTLEIAEGAVLLGSTDRADYPVIPATAADLVSGKELHFGGFEGLAMDMFQALICAEYAEDITIIGPGRVDGNAQNSDWWQVFKTIPTARPRLFFFNRCKNIRMHGIDACNSASWQLHPYYSEDLSFLDVKVSAPKISPNTDALDPEACDRVDIIGCRFSVGDDCIAIKSGKIELGRMFKKSASHHTIRNCLMENGHGAVVLGSEIGAGVKDLTVTQCLFRETDRGLRIKTRRGRGEDCQVTGIVFDNIRMDKVLTPIVVNMWYNCCDPDRYSEYVWSREKLPVDERTPHLGTFSFRNIDCTGVRVAACYIDGLPEMPLDEVELKNVRFEYDPDAEPGVPAMQNFAEPRCRLGMYFDNVRLVRIDHVTLSGQDGKKLIAGHCGSIETTGFEEVE